MSEGWTCSRCATVNDDSRFGCSNCGLLRHDAASVGSSQPAGDAIPRSDPPTAAYGGAIAEPTPLAGGSAEDTTPSQPGLGWVPPDADQAAAAPAAMPIWRRIPVGWLVVALFVAGTAVVGWYFNASRSSTGEITKSGDMTAVDLRVGDCFDLKDPAADEVEDVTAGPCTVAHEFEMFFVGSLPEGAFPAQSVFDTYVTDNCYPAFAAYVGTAYTESELEMYWLAPTADAWGGGDRSVQCAVYHPVISRQTQSLRGSNQ